LVALGSMAVILALTAGVPLHDAAARLHELLRGVGLL
jgi:hypothetical protein